MTRAHTPGFSFSEGRLLIFTEAESFLLNPWPEPKALRKSKSARSWSLVTPAFRLLRPQRGGLLAGDLGPASFAPKVLDPLLAKLRAFQAFRFALPPEIAEALEHFPSRQWRPLQFLGSHPPGLDLFAQNPALAFCVAYNDCLRPAGRDPLWVAAWLAQQKQRAILDWLQFPGTGACAKILAKIIPQAVHVQSARNLLALLKQEDACQLLSHLPRINAGVLALVTEPVLRQACSPSLLAEVASAADEDQNPATATLLNDILLMRQEFAADRNHKVFPSLAKVSQVHGETTAAYCRWKEANKDSVTFPLPPLPGTEKIVPLVTSKDLWEESDQQKNCARTYTNSVSRGEVYLYRVLHPQRATLSIVKGPDDSWQISQLKLACNQPVSPETQQFVTAWLRRYSLSV